MIPRLKIPRPFILIMLVALAWAIYTQHVWEDFYITYRASKNLATGQGLTFTAGERVHSFTSPLGVLLPALASFLTGNSSDTVALWLFRLMGAAALAGTVLILQRTFRQLSTAGIVTTVLTAAVLTDAKIVDFTVNGMETPFLLLLLAWMMWTFFTAPERQSLHLGLAWAGLQWTRPDAFVYIGGLTVGVLLFRPTTTSWRERLGWLRGYIGAGLICTALYLPWLVWAWLYYGTPVPHTITAKGMIVPPLTPHLLFDWVITFPKTVVTDHSILSGTFLPPLGFNTGWPVLAIQVCYGIALLAIVLWLIPGVRWEARVASAAAAIGQFYQYSFVRFPVPWYLPAVALLSLVALILVWGQLWQATGPGKNPSWWTRPGRIILGGGAVLLLLGATSLSVGAAYQLHWQQRIIEDGHRRKIGEWLRASAATPHDSVFLEPLGYIGFFSNLKMLDYPGLCSPEMVAARHRASTLSSPMSWSELILDLEPDWLVLRTHEVDEIRRRDPEVLERFYKLERVFDARPQIAALSYLPGRGYLMFDSYFEIYRRQASFPAGVGLRRVRASNLTLNQCWAQPAYDTGSHLQAHAPAQLEFTKHRGARWISGGFGFLETAYAHPLDGTDGAVFTIAFIAENGTRRVLLERALRPGVEPADQGTHNFRIELPAGESGKIALAISPGPRGDNTYDWTYWSELMLETPH